jgi:hypothetical protein
VSKVYSKRFHSTLHTIRSGLKSVQQISTKLSICKFRENRGREIPNVLTDLNYITCKPCACREDLRNFKSNERLDKACVLRHGELFAFLLRTLREHFLIPTSITRQTTPFFGKTMQLRTFFNVSITYHVLQHSFNEISHRHCTYNLFKIILS